MLQDHMIIARRQIEKQKPYSIVNFIGFTLSVACCLCIALYIRNELNHDQHHPNVDNIYRVVIDTKINAWNIYGKNCAGPSILGNTLAAQIPEITNTARLKPYCDNGQAILMRKEKGKNNQHEENFVYADQSFFEIFHLPLIYGSKEEILTQPNTIVITERIAEKYFPNRNPLGEILVLNDKQEQSYRVTGVVENFPNQSSFDFDFFMAMPTLFNVDSNTTWEANNYYTYVTLAKGTSANQLTEKLKGFSLKNLNQQFKEILAIDVQHLKATSQGHLVELQPFSDIYLYSAGYKTPAFEENGDIRNVLLFALLAFFIFLNAVVNFTNLSMARSVKQAKELDLRIALNYRNQKFIARKGLNAKSRLKIVID